MKLLTTMEEFHRKDNQLLCLEEANLTARSADGRQPREVIRSNGAIKQTSKSTCNVAECWDS